MKTPKRSFPRVGGSAFYPDNYVPGDDEEPDYDAIWQDHKQDWLRDARNTDCLLEGMESNEIAKGYFRDLITTVANSLDDPASYDNLPAGVYTALDTVLKLSGYCEEVAYHPICEEVDMEISCAQEACREQRKYGEVL